MIQFPAYNPINFSKPPVPRYDHETYDDFLQTFYISKGGEISFLFRSSRGILDALIHRYRDNYTDSIVLRIIQADDEYIYYECRFPVFELEAGESYYISIREPREPRVFSNVFKIKQEPEAYDVLRISVHNESNWNGIWVDGENAPLTHELHLEYEVKDTSEIGTNSTMYEMSGSRSIVLDADSFNKRTFYFGGKRGVSRYLANVIKMWLYCDSVSIDGELYRLASEPEFVAIENYDRITVKCEMVRDVDAGMWLSGNNESPRVLPIPQEGDVWILADGTWNDGGVWEDRATWNDAV
jgi:hypothetical protein